MNTGKRIIDVLHVEPIDTDVPDEAAEKHDTDVPDVAAGSATPA